VVGDGRLRRDRTREARRPVWSKEEKGFQDTALRKEQNGSRGRASHAGVRALIVAMKPGNAGGAKGCRKVET
jgi:hypothetical protein